jgi:hypothetical protein
MNEQSAWDDDQAILGIVGSMGWRSEGRPSKKMTGDER